MPLPLLEPYERFAKAFAAVCMATNHEPDPTQIEVYWRALNHIPPEYLDTAASHLIRDEEYFPSVAKWVKAAQVIADHQVAQTQVAAPQLTGAVDRGFGPEYVCIDCEDRGWRYYDAATHQLMPIAQVTGDHGGRYVKPCPCRTTNPVWRKNHPTSPDFARPSRGRRR